MKAALEAQQLAAARAAGRTSRVSRRPARRVRCSGPNTDEFFKRQRFPGRITLNARASSTQRRDIGEESMIRHAHIPSPLR